MKLLLHYLRPHKNILFLSLLMAAINQCFSLMDPYYSGRLLDLFVSHPQHVDGAKTMPRSFNEYIWGAAKLIAMLILVAMVSRIAKAFQDYFSSVVVQKFGAKIFTDGLEHSMKLPYHEFEDQRSGETLSILTKVRTDSEKFILSFINIIFPVFVGLVFVLIFAFAIHWSIPLVYVAGAILLSTVISVLSKKIKSVQKRIVKETTALSGSTTESLRNIELVKSLGLTEQEVNRLNKNTFKILGLELTKVKSIRALSFIQGTIVNTLRQAIVLTLLILIYRDKLTAGQYLQLMFYSFFIFGPLQEIGNIIISYREAETSMNNFHKLMQKAPEPKPTNATNIDVLKNLTFEDVSFQHKTATHPAIQNIHFSVAQGSSIAFVGPSGSGKTTLMKLLVGLYRPEKGRILYNGISGADIDFDTLRQQIGFVSQDTQLFAGTIRENLQFVQPDASNEAMLEALEKASCNTILAKGANGLDTVIGESGLKLSGGEKQRLSIARALLRKPSLLIFDEATSALDSITEEEITTTIKEICKTHRQITVMIAHRLSTIMHADKIVVLEKGHIVEQGTHQQLLNEKELYYAMWRQQIGERKI